MEEKELEASRIRSFEKKAAKNGRPERARFVVEKMVIINGDVKGILVIKRESWEDLMLWIIKPAHIKREDLNIA